MAELTRRNLLAGIGTSIAVVALPAPLITEKALGAVGVVESHTLTVGEMPSPNTYKRLTKHSNVL